MTFESKDASHPAKFYFNSLTAHRNYPDRKVTKADAVVAEMGSLDGSNPVSYTHLDVYKRQVIALPGGCGTLEELLEIITWKQLGLYLLSLIHI